MGPLRFLPPCGLDFNLIEKVFSRLKIVWLRLKMNEIRARAWSEDLAGALTIVDDV